MTATMQPFQSSSSNRASSNEAHDSSVEKDPAAFPASHMNTTPEQNNADNSSVREAEQIVREAYARTMKGREVEEVTPIEMDPNLEQPLVDMISRTGDQLTRVRLDAIEAYIFNGGDR